MTKTNNAPYIEFLTDIKAKIRQSQYEALMGYNSINIRLNYTPLEIRSPKEITEYED